MGLLGFSLRAKCFLNTWIHYWNSVNGKYKRHFNLQRLSNKYLKTFHAQKRKFETGGGRAERKFWHLAETGAMGAAKENNPPVADTSRKEGKYARLCMTKLLRLFCFDLWWNKSRCDVTVLIILSSVYLSLSISLHLSLSFCLIFSPCLSLIQPFMKMCQFYAKNMYI